MKPWKQTKSPSSKPAMAAYLNMARHNVYRSLIYISRQMQVPVENGEESHIADLAVWKKLSEGTEPEKMKMIKLLQRHFPVLKAIFDVEKKKGDLMVAASPKKMKAIFLQSLLPVLNSLRNEYTHYAPGERKKGEEKKLVPYLYRTMDGAASEVRKRFELTVNDPKQGKNEGAKVAAVNQAVEYIFQGPFRKEEVVKKGKDGKELKDKRGFPKKEFRDKSDYFFALGSSDTGFSDIAIVFFTCLFLEKRYIAMLLDAVKPWPQTFDEIQRKAVFEVFSIYNIRLPREKYDSTRPKHALGLDMLNELQKCPKELFDILSDKNRDALSVEIKAEGADVVTDDGVTVKDGKVQMRRVRDRFAPLALQYLDRQDIFEHLRFMVHLGNYRHTFYMKQCLADDGPRTLRILQKEINGFGRIDEVELERKKQYSSLFKTTVKTTVKTRNGKDVEVLELVADAPDSSPYVTDTKAHYLIDNHRVGLRLDKALYLPDLQEVVTREDGKTEKKPISDAGKIKLYSPQAWLSTYELPGLIFYLYLCRTYPDAARNEEGAEAVIASYINAYQRLFEDIRTGAFEGWNEHRYAPLMLGDLPVKIRKFITAPDTKADPCFKEKAKKRIENMIIWTENEQKGFDTKLSKMSDKTNKLNKKRYVDLRPGTIASKLVRDILFFAPPSEAKSRITSANFNSLQSALTVSELEVAKVRTMVKGLKHPFLGKALDRHEAALKKSGKNAGGSAIFKIFDFYKIYLACRLDYLNSIDLSGKADLKDLPFLHSGRIRWQVRDKDYIRGLAGRYLEEETAHGFELPRGLFTSRAKSLLLTAGVQLCDAESDREPSMANLVNLYFSKVLGDDNQTFYRWERHYDLFDKLSTNKNQIRPVHHFMKPEQLCKKMRERKQLVPSEYMLKKAVNSVNQTLPQSKKLPVRPDHLLNKSFKDPRVVELAMENLKKDYALYDDNERMLRRFAVQDKILYLIAKNILLGIEGVDEESLNQFKLRDIRPGKDNSILEMQVPFQIEIEVDDITLTIKQKEKIKIKRFGEFFRYNSDTRLRSLLRFLNKTGTHGNINIEVDRDMLDAELANYDLQRVAVMKMVQAMEQSVLSKAKWPQTEVASDVRENFNKLISTVGKIPYEPQGHILINIRNSFCHNEYAREIAIPDNTPLPQVAEMISKLFDAERKRQATQAE